MRRSSWALASAHWYSSSAVACCTASGSDIYMLADCLTSQDDITLIECKDYIKHPKENGYRSLHLIVQVPIFLQNEKRNMKVEVQLRTIAMEFWANLEHRLRYKKDLPEGIPATSFRLSSMADSVRGVSPFFVIFRRMLSGDLIRVFMFSMGLRSCCRENCSFRTRNLVSTSMMAQR